MQQQQLMLVSFCVLAQLALSSPVRVSINEQSAIDLGNYDRARFDLTETFHPLQPASAVSADHAKAAVKAAGVKNNNEASISIGFPMEQIQLQPLPERLAFGEWTEWTEWTSCENGERSRVRTCVSRRPAMRVVCHGESIEIQKCYVDVSHESRVPVANDPWSIEREISGDFKA